MKIKIISDGTSINTRVVDAETGEVLGGVQSVEWDVDAQHPLACATLRVVGVPVEVEAEVEVRHETRSKGR